MRGSKNFLPATDYVVAVGGAGLYVRALCEGMDDLPQADESLREEMDRWLAEEGLGALAEKLRELDPEYYRIVDLNNPARVVRALEVCLQTACPTPGSVPAYGERVRSKS